MINQLQHFFNMGGYALYVWGAYSSMILLLGWPLFKAWYRIKQLRLRNMSS